MRNSLTTLIVVLSIITGGLGIGVTAEVNTDDCLRETVEFSNVQITEHNGYSDVSLPEETAKTMHTGAPVLPVVSKVYTFPIGTEITGITCEFTDPTEISLTAKITPAPQAAPLLPQLQQQITRVSEDEEIYKSDDIYPDTHYSTHIGTGLDNDNGHVIYVTVRCHPLRYQPNSNKLIFHQKTHIQIDFKQPKTRLNTPLEYDLAVIAPSKFVGNLMPLVEHKNRHGIETILVSTEEIYGNYTGRDKPEQIKYFIKDAIETYGITYVLLVGGRIGQSQRWYIPERVTHNDDGWEGGYASDLYYADIYKMEGNQRVFEDWDSNENDVFAEWSTMIGQGDVMDYYPDVYVGRLACRYNYEVRNVVNKIIYYESGNCLPKWYKRMILVGGDTFPNNDPWYEGELETALGGSYIEPHGFKIIKLWTSDGSFNSTDDVTSTISEGAGFVYFAGHGNPSTWSTHPPNNKSQWIDGLPLRNMRKLRNRNKYPVVVVGGCHNAQFNVTMTNIIHDWITYVKQYIQEEGLIKGLINGTLYYWGLRFYFMEWVPESWSWWLASKPKGGSIATIGMTSLGYGYIGNHTTEGLGGWIDSRFFHAIGMQAAPKLGAAHSQAITDYINIIGNVNKDQIDRKTIEAWCLLGDPSLVFGGYSE